MARTKTEASRHATLREICSNISRETLDVALSKLSEDAASELLQAVSTVVVAKPMPARKKTSTSSSGPRPSGVSKKPRKPMKKNPYARRKKKPAASQPTPGWTVDAANAASKGLYNEGTWCYRNALLQCLLHMPAYCNALAIMHPKCTLGARRCVRCALKNVATRYWGRSQFPANAFANPGADLDAALRRAISPEDVRIGEDIHRPMQSCPFDIWEVGFVEQLHGGKDTTNNDSPMITSTFQIQTKEVWTCHTCLRFYDNVASVTERGIDVGITKPKPGLPLEEYIDNEWATWDVPRTCENPACADSAPGSSDRPPQIMRRIITSGPDVLVIRFRRFGFKTNKNGEEITVPTIVDGKTMMYRVEDRLDHVTSFPEELDLSQYVEGDARLVYKIEGVVSHRGQTIERGHYVATVRRKNGRGINIVNDSRVIEVRNKKRFIDMMNDPGKADEDYKDFRPCVLFYRKTAG
ncbi:hypothetical protein CLAFUR4_02883 [Fulvia fulva]|nr:hypothetical protein CLAFUR4_02883 [Fulvia fulva]WPV26085.1 hypothetical protein CLAFUW7_02887 [Fulvia fulva]